MAKNDKRNAIDKPPSVVLIKPDGHFYRSLLATNVNDGIVKIEDGKTAIREGAKAKGYVFLADGCDSPEQAAALQKYFDLEEREGVLERIPDEMLPKLCVERRARAAKAKAVDWAALGFEKRPGARKGGDADGEAAPRRGQPRA